MKNAAFVLLIFTIGSACAQEPINWLEPPAFVETFYKDAVLAQSPLVYWPLNEESGSIIDNATGNSLYDVVTSKPIYTRPFFNSSGINFSVSPINIYSAALNTNFDRATGSIMLWFRALTKDTWIPASTSRRIINIAADDNNRFIIQLNTDASISAIRISGAVTKTVVYSFASSKPLTWQNLILTWSTSSDQFKLYINGTQQGGTITGLTAMSGALSSTRTVIGAQGTDNTLPLQDVVLSNVAIWNSVLSAGQITALQAPPSYTPPSTTLTHSIAHTWDLFAEYGLTGESLAYFLYDVNSDGSKDLVSNLGRRPAFAATSQTNVHLWSFTANNGQTEPGRFSMIKNNFLYYPTQNRVYAVNITTGSLAWMKTPLAVIPPAIDAAKTNYGIVVGGNTTLDVLDYTTGNSLGGNWPVTTPWTIWEQSISVGDVTGDGNEEIFCNDHFGNINCYNPNGTVRYSIFTATTHYDWYETIDMDNDGDLEMITCTDYSDNSTQVAGEGNEISCYDGSTGALQWTHDGPITGGLQFHVYQWPNGGRVAYTSESDYSTHMVAMLAANGSVVWSRDVGTPYEGDQIVLTDVDGDNIPEILFSTEVFNERSGFRVLRWQDGLPKLFFTEDGPTVLDDIVDARGSATHNRQGYPPYTVPYNELLQGILRTTDNTGHDIIYLHKWIP